MTRSTTWRRRRPIGAGLLAVLAVSLLSSGAGAGEDFVAGSGRARASIFEIVPRTGGLTLPVSFGRAAAAYQGASADASSTAVRAPEGSPPPAPAADCGGDNPGNPGGGGGGGGGGGSAGPPQNPFASTIRITSEDKDSEAGRRATSPAAPAGGPVQGAASEQEVAATDDPSSRATTVEGRFDAAEVIGYTQARAEATAGVVEGRARLASATVTLDRLDLLDGLVTIERLRWEATQRTGDDPQAAGTFSVGRVLLGGTPLPGPPPAGGNAVLGPLNEALAPTGVAVTAPAVETDGGVVRVSPLTVRFADSPVGRATLGTALGSLQPVRDPVVDALLGLSCDVGTAVLVADVVASIASGSGGVSFDVGGVSATTEGTRYDNPFDGPLGDPFGALEPPPLPAPAAPRPEPAGDELLAAPLPYEAPLLALPESFVPGPLAAVTPPEPAGGTPVAALAQPVRPSSRRLPGSRGGPALVVGAIGLLAVVVLAGADARHLRRAARSTP